jgi:osmotically inducible protein OsmC
VWKNTPYSSKAVSKAARSRPPEELIAACRLLHDAARLRLDARRHQPKSIDTTAEVSDPREGANITGIKLKTTVVAPGAMRRRSESAETAKEICPVSKALKVVLVTLEVEAKV